MEADITQSVEDVLSSREKASLLMAQDLYSIRAKEAALELAGVTGLEGETAEQFLGGIASQLDGMDWEQRRQAAESLREAGQALGATALDRGKSAELSLVRGSSGDTTKGSENSHPGLSTQQRRWLSSIVDVQVVNDIARLSVSGRLVFANNLGCAYEGFLIRRLSESDKAERAQHLNDLILGKSFAEIAESVGTREVNVGNRFKSMAVAIQRELTPEEIVGMIPGEYVEQPEVLSSLNRIQKGWCAKVFTSVEGAEEQITELDPQQREQMAELLVRRLKAYIARRNGPEKTRRRAKQVILLMRGSSLAEIVGSSGLNEATVKSELHRSATVLNERTSPDDLQSILRQAAEYTGEQPDATA